MSAITYISGPHPAATAESPPRQTERIRHDYAYLADRPVDIFNSDQPVTRCDRCLKVAMTTIVVTVTVLLYALSYLKQVGAQ